MLEVHATRTSRPGAWQPQRWRRHEGGRGKKKLPWRVSFLPGSPYWPVKPLWLEQMQMALTCSHKILKAHSNEAPGHNAAVAERSVEAGQPPVWERERQRFFLPLHSSFWLSGGEQSSTLITAPPWTQTQDKVTLHLACNSALSNSQTLLHCPELYPIITSYVMLCNWTPADLNCSCYQVWHQPCSIITRCLTRLSFCKECPYG